MTKRELACLRVMARLPMWHTLQDIADASDGVHPANSPTSTRSRWKKKGTYKRGRATAGSSPTRCRRKATVRGINTMAHGSDYPNREGSMNKEQRGMLDDITTELTDIQSRLDSICEDETEKYENMPENLQSSDKGERQLAVTEALSTACDSTIDILTNIDEAVNA